MTEKEARQLVRAFTWLKWSVICVFLMLALLSLGAGAWGILFLSVAIGIALAGLRIRYK